MPMTVGEQLEHALWRGPASIRLLRGKGWALWLAYLVACGAILGLVGHEFVAHRGDAAGWVTSYVLPKSWRFAGTALIDRFLRSQLRDVVVNAIIGTTLLAAQIVLFPLKEKVSATFEEQADLTGEPPHELPLWLEGIEEVQLFLLFLTAQMTIFWIGYSPEPWRKHAALILSYAFLFASFGIDFLSPVLQRHHMRYATMFKVFARHPVAVLAFGAFFTLPPVLVGKLVTAHHEWGMARATGLLFGANVLCIAWAAIAGTWVGARLLPDAKATRRPSAVTRVLAFAAFAALFAWNVWRFGSVGLALHHKSQILKCDYRLDWSSVGLDKPSLSLASVLSRQVTVGVHADVTITNPTRWDVDLEKNHVDILHHGDRVATASLTPVHIPAGGRTTQRMSFPLTVSPSVVAKGRELLDPRAWEITLYLQVADGFDFPIYLLEPTR